MLRRRSRFFVTDPSEVSASPTIPATTAGCKQPQAYRAHGRFNSRPAGEVTGKVRESHGRHGHEQAECKKPAAHPSEDTVPMTMHEIGKGQCRAHCQRSQNGLVEER